MREPPSPDAEPDWRRPETYAYTETLTRRGWAWEFLRRNPAFRADLAGDAAPVSNREVSERNDLKRWGICFRCLRGTCRRRREGLLGSGTMSVCLALDAQSPRVRDAADSTWCDVDGDDGLRETPPARFCGRALSPTLGLS